jgi:hypothetical protein
MRELVLPLNRVRELVQLELEQPDRGGVGEEPVTSEGYLGSCETRNLCDENICLGRTCTFVLMWMKPSCLSRSDSGNSEGIGSGGAVGTIL